MPFRDYFDVEEPLELPYNGKNYTIPPISLDAGVRLTEGLSPNSEKPLTDEEFYRLVLGDALDELRSDHVKPAAIERFAKTALADHQRGRATAELMWETGGDPKALQEWSAAIKAASTSTSTAEEPTTPTPKRGSGTSRSRQKSSE